MISETIRFYSTHEKDAVGKVFLCGGFSLVSTFTEMLTDALPVETVLLNPLDHVQWDVPAAQQEFRACGPALAVATGLAMRTL
jgi:Tfp pilus assembly PilM family ATPase